MNTKNVFMLAVLSAVMLTGLAVTTIQTTPAFASKDECEKNSDYNCNELKDRSQLITTQANCKVEAHDASADGGDTGDNSGNGGTEASVSPDNAFDCVSQVNNPNTGDIPVAP